MYRRSRLGTPSKRVAGSVHMFPWATLHLPQDHQRPEQKDASGGGSFCIAAQSPSGTCDRIASARLQLSLFSSTLQHTRSKTKFDFRIQEAHVISVTSLV
jgi:hypothetical protein